MENPHPRRAEDYTTANLILILVNLLWIFGLVWSQLGIGAVLVLGAVLNHMITRLEVGRARREAGFQRFDAQDMPQPAARQGGDLTQAAERLDAVMPTERQHR